MRRALAAVAVVILVQAALAQPQVNVTRQPVLGSGNQVFLFSVDSTVNSSYGFELAFDGVADPFTEEDVTDWDAAGTDSRSMDSYSLIPLVLPDTGQDQPGNNPFTETTTFGWTYDDLNDQLFMAAGTLETPGTSIDVVQVIVEPNTVARWGWSVRPEINPVQILVDGELVDTYVGGVVAQGGTSYYFEGGIFASFYGDANLDGTVDGQDFSLLKANFGGSAGWEGGDFNGDGTVDGQDFSLLKANFGISEGALPAASSEDVAELNAFGATIVPEPASLVLLLIGGVALARHRRV